MYIFLKRSFSIFRVGPSVRLFKTDSSYTFILACSNFPIDFNLGMIISLTVRYNLEYSNFSFSLLKNSRRDFKKLFQNQRSINAKKYFIVSVCSAIKQIFSHLNFWNNLYRFCLFMIAFAKKSFTKLKLQTHVKCIVSSW